MLTLRTVVVYESFFCVTSLIRVIWNPSPNRVWCHCVYDLYTTKSTYLLEFRMLFLSLCFCKLKYYSSTFNPMCTFTHTHTPVNTLFLKVYDPMVSSERGEECRRMILKLSYKACSYEALHVRIISVGWDQMGSWKR